MVVSAATHATALVDVSVIAALLRSTSYIGRKHKGSQSQMISVESNAAAQAGTSNGGSSTLNTPERCFRQAQKAQALELGTWNLIGINSQAWNQHASSKENVETSSYLCWNVLLCDSET